MAAWFSDAHPMPSTIPSTTWSSFSTDFQRLIRVFIALYGQCKLCTFGTQTKNEADRRQFQSITLAFVYQCPMRTIWKITRIVLVPRKGPQGQELDVEISEDGERILIQTGTAG